MAAENESTKNNEKQQTPTYLQVYLAIIANITILAPGMNVGYSAIALPTLTDPNNPVKLDPNQASWFASIASIATPLGCLISGPFLDRMGRKWGLYVTNVVMFLGWIIIATADSSNASSMYTTLLIGRFVAGLGTGLASIPATVYVSEISSPKMRGMLATWTTVAFALGVLFIYILGFVFQDDWKLSAIISSIIPVIGLVLAIFLIPESPVWLQRKGRLEEAENSRRRLKQSQYKIVSVQVVNDDEIQKSPEVKGKINVQNGLVYKDTCEPMNSDEINAKLTLKEKLIEELKYFTKPECAKPLLIMSIFFFFQQFSGTIMIVFYAVDIIIEAGVTFDPYLMAVMIGIIRTIASIMIGHISKRYGRRPPSIVSGAGMAICMVMLAEYVYLIAPKNPSQISLMELQLNATMAPTTETYFDNNGTLTNMSFVPQVMLESTPNTLKWIPVVLLLCYFFVSTIGFLSIPFAMIGEIYPTQVRGLFSGLTSCIGYSFAFIIIKLYPAMLRSMGRAGLFLFYGAVALVGAIFVYFFLPETKGKTLLEIEDYFRNKIDETSSDDNGDETEIEEKEGMLERNKKVLIV